MKDKIIIAVSNITMLTHASYGFLKYEDGKHYVDKERLNEFFRVIANGGANATRILPYSPFANKFPRAQVFQPYKFVLSENMWDLTEFNENYFKILKEVVETANKYNLKVWFSLFDDCQFFKEARDKSPWVHNIQGWTTFMDGYNLPKKWIKKVVKELSDYDVAYELGNELSPRIGKKESVKWTTGMIEYLIKELKVKPVDLMYGAIMEECKEFKEGNCKIDFLDSIKGEVDKKLGEEVKLSILKPVHQIYSKKSKEFPYGIMLEQSLSWWGKRKPIRVWWSDDGTFDADEKDNCDVDLGATIPERRPSYKDWKDILNFILANKVIGQTYFPRIAIEHLPANLESECIKKTVEAISETYKEHFGVFPKNFGKFPEEEVPPPLCVEHEVLMQKCKNGETIITHICKGGKWVETGEYCKDGGDNMDTIKKILNWLFGKDSMYQKNPQMLFWITFSLWLLTIILCLL